MTEHSENSSEPKMPTREQALINGGAMALINAIASNDSEKIEDLGQYLEVVQEAHRFCVKNGRADIAKRLRELFSKDAL